MPNWETDLGKAREASFLARLVLNPELAPDLRPGILARIHELHPHCRPYWDGANLALYVRHGRAIELPKGLKFAASYIEEVFPDGSARVVKTRFAANQGYILPQTTEL